jgi:hypothetical protein
LQWVEACKIEVLEAVDELQPDLFLQVRAAYEQRVAGKPKTSEFPSAFDEKMLTATLSIEDPTLEIEMLKTCHERELNTVINSIKGASDFYSLYHDCHVFYIPSAPDGTLESKVQLLYRLPRALELRMRELVDDLYQTFFGLYYEELWKVHFNLVYNPPWFKRIDNHAATLTSRRKRFDFFWTITKKFIQCYYNIPIEKLLFSSNRGKQKVLDEIHESLVERCLVHRPRPIVNYTEATFIQYLSRSWFGKQGFTLGISSIENFIRTNFQCLDSSADKVDAPYSVKITNASNFIALLRIQYEENFGAPALNGQTLSTMYRKNEFKRWIEFAFRNADGNGFSEGNILTYFSRNVNRKVNMKSYRIKKVKPSKVLLQRKFRTHD